MSSAADAGTLVCPSCGAPVSSGDRLCGHCQAELATVRCSACFSLAVAGDKRCSECGAVLGLEGMLGATGLRCPRCLDVELVGIHVGEHQVAECLKCTGLLVEHAVLDVVTRRGEERAGLRLRPIAIAPTTPETTTYLLCPQCSAHMGRKRFGERSGIVVDVCARHGVWFDRDEIARALEFIDGGGLSRIAERDRVAASRRRLHADDRRVDPSALGSYDMVGSFLASLFRPPE